MAYVYTHTRLDINEIFYIGIGSDILGKHKRAFSKKRRGKFWRDMIKNREYQVNIIYDNLSWKDVCKKEIELIAKYGRRDLGKGTLVNLTNGGDGVYGYIHTKEALLKLSINSTKHTKSCIHFDTNLRFKSLKEGCEHFGLVLNKQRNAVKQRLATAKFYYESTPFIRPTKEEKSKRVSEAKKKSGNGKYNPVIHIETGLEFKTIKDGCRHFNLMYDAEHNKVTKNLNNRHFTLKINVKDEEEQTNT